MDVRFPLPSPPLCNLCGSAASRRIVGAGNMKGNALRPYYTCGLGHKRVFITWDDDRDIAINSPRCLCGYPSRQHQGNGLSPETWLACSAQKCSFTLSTEAHTHVLELDPGTQVRIDTQGRLPRSLPQSANVTARYLLKFEHPISHISI